MDEGGEVICDFCKDIGTDEKALLTHEMVIGDGNICEYGVYVYRQYGKVVLSLCDADNGETAYTEIHNCPMCGRNLSEDK